MENEGFKILIVDDSLLNQEALRRMLMSENDVAAEGGQAPYTVFTASSGPSALEKVTADLPDIILLDVIMPGMSGFDVLARLKESDFTKSVPTIIISGLSEEEDEEKGFSLGAVDYIKKPFKKSIVLARIKTHLKIVEQMRIIEQLSLMDTLTNIPNRRSFDNRIKMEWGRAIREHTPLSLLMIDVDRFKRFNDTYGHQQGDVALKTVANAIKIVLKRPCDLAARWGGEEFTVLLPSTDLPGARYVAEEIRKSVESAFVPSIGEHPPLNVTISIGVSTVTPTIDLTIADLVSNADKALYTAKETGRNRVCS